MYAKNVIAAGALLSVVAAVPMVKRDVVWVTETDEAVVTVPVTTTVWVNPGESVPTTSATSSVSHYGHHRSRITTHATSYVTVAAPSSSEESSVASSTTEAAPTTPSTTSTSVYVAPTTTSTTEAAPTTPSTTSTSVYVAPTTTSAPEAAPTTTSTSVWVAPTTSTSSAAPAASSSVGDNSSGLTGSAAPGTTYSGDLTWYDTGLGACGITSAPSDHIVAIAESLFDEYTPASGNPNANPLCGKTVTITGVNGSPYTATIVDRCGGCQKADLDLSQDFFNSVTNNGDGRVHNMSWKFD